jgi:hypothetical protein
LIFAALTSYATKPVSTATRAAGADAVPVGKSALLDVEIFDAHFA